MDDRGNVPQPELLSELLARCRAGEADAFGVLVRRFQPWATEFAAALLGDDKHQAEDAVQDAFVVALARLHELRDPQAFAGWFRQIVRTQANRIRRSCRPATRLTETSAIAAGLSSHDLAELDEHRRLVRDALLALAPKGREAVELYYFDGLDGPAIADRLGVPAGTVKRRLHDAREKLRAALPPPGFL